MFENDDLKTVRSTAKELHELYVEMRTMYVELAHAYIKIRIAVDELTNDYSGYELMNQYFELYGDNKAVDNTYSMPLLMADGSFMTLHQTMFFPLDKHFIHSIHGFYINGKPAFLYNDNDEHFNPDRYLRYYDPETIELQMKYIDELNPYYWDLSDLKFRIKNTNFLHIIKKNNFQKKYGELNQEYEAKKSKVAYLFEDWVSGNDVIYILLNTHGTIKKKYSRNVPYDAVKMLSDALPCRRPKNLTEEEEIRYWKDYITKVAQEIQNIRTYTPSADDAYIAYEAYVNNVDKSYIVNNCSSYITTYRKWLSTSCLVYFHNKIAEARIDREDQAERRKNRADFYGKLMGIRSDGIYDSLSDLHWAESVSRDVDKMYDNIDKKAAKGLKSDLKYIDQKWKSFKMSEPLI